MEITDKMNWIQEKVREIQPNDKAGDLAFHLGLALDNQGIRYPDEVFASSSSISFFWRNDIAKKSVVISVIDENNLEYVIFRDPDPNKYTGYPIERGQTFLDTFYKLIQHLDSDECVLKLNNQFSFCLYVCGNDPARKIRLKNALSCFDRLKNKNYEVILIEQSVDGKYYYTEFAHLCSTYQRVFHDKGFNQSWCRNLSVKYAKHNTCIVYDMDMIISQDYLDTIDSQFRDGVTTLALGANCVLMPTEYEMQGICLDNNPKYYANKGIVTRKKYPGRQGGVGMGHIMIVNREWFFTKMGGFLESLYWWGKEDEEFVSRCGVAIPDIPSIEEVVLHQWHEGRDMSALQNNIETIEKLRRKHRLSEISELIKNCGVARLSGPSPVEV